MSNLVVESAAVLQDEDVEEEEEEEEAETEEDAIERMKTEISENYESEVNMVTAAVVSDWLCISYHLWDWPQRGHSSRG